MGYAGLEERGWPLRATVSSPNRGAESARRIVRQAAASMRLGLLQCQQVCWRHVRPS